MTLLQLSYFVEVCNCKSMTKAAAKLYVSQPAITKAIQDLEKEYGAVLLIRRKSGQTLTYEGQTLYVQAQKLLQCAKEVNDAMRQVCAKQKVMRIGISVLFAKLFPGLIKAFQQAYPDVEVKSYAFGSETLHRYIKDGTLDVALSGTQFNTPLPMPHRILANTESCFWTNRSNALSQKQLIRIETDLNNEPIALFRENSTDILELDSISQNARQKSPAANIVFCTNQLGEIHQMLLDNAASTFLPKHIFDGRQELVSVPLNQPMYFTLSAYWHDEYAYSYVMDFVNFAEEYLNQNSEPGT